MELKLTGIALNHSKNHTEERTTDKGVQVLIFLLESPWMEFLNRSRNYFFFAAQILIISPLRNGRRDTQITILTQRSRSFTLIEHEPGRNKIRCLIIFRVS